jgi:hypothetical protein
MKKNLLFSGIAMALILSMASCSSGIDEEPVFDNPAAGTMTEVTALRIFSYTATPDGGIRIDKFKSAAALKQYLATAPAASINSRAAAGSSLTSNTLFLCKIGNRNVVAIGSGAFTPTAPNTDTDITTIVTIIKLPPTVTAIAKDSFSGTFANMPTLAIEEDVWDLLPPDTQAGLRNSVKVSFVEVSAYSAPVSEIFGKFLGTLTLDQLLHELGMGSYAVESHNANISLFLDAGLTNKVNGSTTVTKNTLLYSSAEDIIPEITMYPGLDTTATWPQDSNSNTISSGNLYFRLSTNGKALACNPFSRGDGRGTWIPNIWLLEESTGAFPEGTWIYVAGGGYEEKLIFASGKLTRDSPSFDTDEYSYTISGNTFVCTYIGTITYVPTAQDNAKIAAFNDAAYRAAHPWVPATSTITPTATKEGVQYWIDDNPDMSFVDDTDVHGTWTVIDEVIKPEWFDPNDLDLDGGHWLESLTFNADGSTAFNSYQAVANSWTKGLWKHIEGSANLVAASKYEIRTVGGRQYLFVENKNGNYHKDSEKPQWFVLRK